MVGLGRIGTELLVANAVEAEEVVIQACLGEMS